jgi:hypothetical protein
LRALVWFTLFVATLFSSELGAREALPGRAATRALTALEAPPAFEVNQGQAADGVRFLARGANYTLYLREHDAFFRLPTPPERGKAGTAVVRFEFAGDRRGAPPEAVGKLARRSNYFLGNDRARWRTNVPNFSSVRYSRIHDGIDLVFRAGEGGLVEYDFVVAPGGDPAAIRLRFPDADRLAIDAGGDLEIWSGGVALTSRAPAVYQVVDGRNRSVDGRYRIVGDHEVAFTIGAYDARLNLVIDPVLVYSTYLGGSEADDLEGIAVDADGHAYVAGDTLSADFPVVNAFDNSYNGFRDISVTKFTPDGTDIVYSTYIGGAEEVDAPQAIALDQENNVYITGSTHSDDFPLVGALQNTRQNEEGFVTKLNADGDALVYSTFLGGSDNDAGLGIAVDAEGNAYVAGGTLSPDLATTAGAFDEEYSGAAEGWPGDGFVAKLTADGSALDYLTYLGGSEGDGAWGIALDDQANAYIAADSHSADFPGNGQESSLDGSLGGTGDAVVAKLDATGASLIYWTFVGGDGIDTAEGIDLDADNNAYVTGWTRSENFPTSPGAFQGADPGEEDAFVLKLNAAGDGLVYSTYLGGSSFDEGTAIAVDADGYDYVTGNTDSTDFPERFALQSDQPDGDAFAAKVNQTGSGLVYSTYLGGDDRDEGHAIAVDSEASAYIAGATESGDFPVQPPDDPFQTDQGRRDGFVTKIASDEEPFRFEYVAKIVCGTQADRADMRLARGFYATSVNIHSPGEPQNRIYKKLALAYPPEEQAAGEVLPIGEDVLNYDEALKTDCNDIRRRLFPNDFPAPYIEGFVIVQSTRRLDVTAVYTTAAIDREGQVADHSSIDVEQIAERDLGVDLRIDKVAEVFPFAISDNLTLFAVLYTIDIENSGPETADEVHVFDELLLEVANAVGSFAVLQMPIDLPPGGSMTNLVGTGTSASFDLALGDLDPGASLTARFWVLALTYETGGPASAVLRNTATADSQSPEITASDNTIVIETQLLP